MNIIQLFWCLEGACLLWAYFLKGDSNINHCDTEIYQIPFCAVLSSFVLTQGVEWLGFIALAFLSWIVLRAEEARLRLASASPLSLSTFTSKLLYSPGHAFFVVKSGSRTFYMMPKNFCTKLLALFQASS